MGITAPIYIMYFASLPYPGVNLPLTVIVAIGSSLVLASIYFILTISMPRSGGDYVWVSRIIHPSTGRPGVIFGMGTYLLALLERSKTLDTMIVWNPKSSLPPGRFLTA